MAADARHGRIAKQVPARDKGSIDDRPLPSGDGGDSELEQRTSLVGSRERLRSWSVPLTVFLLAALYLVFVLTYSVDVPRDDDGGTVLLIHSALHGQFSFSYFWSQHLESRIFVLNLIFLAVGYLDHLDLRTVMILSALILVGAFLLLLRLFRIYLDRPLTALPVLLVGLVWFSLIDVTNALWAFQVAWYVVLFCLIVIPYLLLASRWPRTLNVALAIVAAVVATFSALQGVIAWPEGLLLLLWATPSVRRTIIEVSCWLLACALSGVAFLHGYIVSAATGLCPPAHDCTLGYSLEHPVSLARFIFVLVGESFRTFHGLSTLSYEVIGVILLFLAAVVIVESIREMRTGGSRIPLPITLVGLGLLFDVVIALGRLGFGDTATGQYAMPQTLLLAGLIIFAVSRVPSGGGAQALSGFALLGYSAIVIIVIAQTATATDFGLREANVIKQSAVLQARLDVNFSRIPASEDECYESRVLAGGLLISPFGLAEYDLERSDLSHDQWSLFQPASYRQFRAEGLPRVPPCEGHPTSHPQS
jgi:hypothetical protein